MPRVLILMHDFGTYSETFLVERMKALLACGCHLTILAREAGPMAATHLKSLQTVSNDFEVVYTKVSQGRLLKRFLALAIGKGNLKLARGVFRIMKHNRFPFPKSRLVELALAILERQNQFDCTIAFFGPYGIKAVWLKSIGCRIGPIACSFHGYDVVKIPREHGPEIYKELYSGAELILSNCLALGGLIQKGGCPKDKIKLVHSTIDLRIFGSQIKDDFRGRDLRLLAVGRLVEKKGFSTLIRAVKNLVSRGVRVECRIVGDGPLYPNLKKLIEVLDLEGVVSLEAPTDSVGILNHLSWADLFVLPCKVAASGDIDAIPNVLKEAMATGVIAVSTDVGGVSELIRHGENGFLVEADNPERFAAQLEALKGLPVDDLNLIRCRARESVEAEYSFEAGVRVHQEVLQQLRK